MNWLMLAGSLGGVLALAAAAWALGLGGAALEDEDDARIVAEGLLPGFEAVGAKLSGDGAIVTGADGRRVQLRRLGARYVAEPVS